MKIPNEFFCTFHIPKTQIIKCLFIRGGRRLTVVHALFDKAPWESIDITSHIACNKFACFFILFQWKWAEEFIFPLLDIRDLTAGNESIWCRDARTLTGRSRKDSTQTRPPSPTHSFQSMIYLKKNSTARTLNGRWTRKISLESLWDSLGINLWLKL